MYAGGDFIADAGAAESEGLLVVMGDATFDKTTGGAFNVGWVGVGSQAAPAPGGLMLAVGGSVTVGATTTLDVGSGAENAGGFPIGGRTQVGGGTNPVYPSPRYELNNGSMETGMGASAVADYATFGASIASSSASWVALADTNPSTVAAPQATFTGDGTTATQVFTITAAQANSITEVYFVGIHDDAPVIINVEGPGPITFSPNYFAEDGVRADAFGSSEFGHVAQRTMWNFADATSVTFGGGSQFLGSVMAPDADLQITASMNGRVYAGGDIHTSGAGNELHNYPWIGDAQYDCRIASDNTVSGTAQLTKVLDTDGVVEDNRAFGGWLRCEGTGVDGTLFREGVIVAGQTLQGRDLPIGADCLLFEDPYRVIEGIDQDPLPAGFIWAVPRWSVDGVPVASPEFVVPGPDDPRVEVTVTNALLARFSVQKTVTDPNGDYLGTRTFDISYTCDAEGFDDDGEPLGAGSDAGTMSLADAETEVSQWFPIGTVCEIDEQLPTAQPGDFTPGSTFTWLAPEIDPATVTIGAGDVSTIPVTVTNSFEDPSMVGSFTIDKVVANPAGVAFTDAFTGAWSCTEGGQTRSGTWSVSAAAPPVEVDGIPIDSVCTVTESVPANPAGGVWDAPRISPAFTITATPFESTVTNTLRAAAAVGGGGAGGGLAGTGSTVPWWAITLGGGILVAGVFFVVAGETRRRRS